MIFNWEIFQAPMSHTGRELVQRLKEDRARLEDENAQLRRQLIEKSQLLQQQDQGGSSRL